MKAWLKKVLQKILGFDRYLFLFALAIITTLRWNRNERDFLFFLKMIPDKGTVLDIGANIGIMSVWLGRRLRNTKIFAFEPIPQNFIALRKVLEYYEITNVQIIEKAVGNQHGEVEMIMPVLDDVKMQGLSHIVHESIHEFNDGNRYKASMIRLDDFEPLQDEGMSLVAIKLDVENFEFFALKGATGIIQKHRPLIYAELWDNDNRQHCFNLLTSLNYKIKVIDKKNLVTYNPLQHKTQNFFFVP